MDRGKVAGSGGLKKGTHRECPTDQYRTTIKEVRRFTKYLTDIIIDHFTTIDDQDFKKNRV